MLIEGGLLLGLWAAVAALAGAVLTRRSLAAAGAGRPGAARYVAFAAAFAQASSIAALMSLGVFALPMPETHAYAAAAWALLVYAVLHAAIALICAAFVGARIASGHVSARRLLEPSVARLFSDYSGAATLIALACVLAPAIVP